MGYACKPDAGIRMTKYVSTRFLLADVDYEYVNVVGMDTKPTVAAYIEMNYGIRHDFIGWVVLIIFAYIFVFLGVAAVSLKKLNFQQK